MCVPLFIFAEKGCCHATTASLVTDSIREAKHNKKGGGAYSPANQGLIQVPSSNLFL